MGSVLGPRALAVSTVAAVTLLLMIDAGLRSLQPPFDPAQRLMLQEAMTGLGYLALALLVNSLARRLAREERRAIESQEAARIQAQVNELVIENLLDLSHLSFVHKSTIGNYATAENAEVKTLRSEHDVTVARWILDAPAPPTYVKAGGFKGNVDRWQFINFTPPCFVRLDVGALDTGKGAPQKKTGAFAAEGELAGGIEMRNLNAITPETDKSCHYFWAQAHNFLLEQPQVTEMLFQQIDLAFRQDWEVFETQQRWMDIDPAAPRIDVNGDAGQIQGIRLLRRKIAEEAAASAPRPA